MLFNDASSWRQRCVLKEKGQSEQPTSAKLKQLNVTEKGSIQRPSLQMSPLDSLT